MLNYNLYKRNNLFLLESFIDDEDLINDLIQNSLEKINEYNDRETNVKAKFSGYFSMNKLPVMDKLMNYITPYMRLVIDSKSVVVKDSWANLMEDKNDFVRKHNHVAVENNDRYNDGGLSGVVYLTDTTSHTIFHNFDYNKDFYINDKRGKFILFSKEIDHSVPVNLKEEKRLTMAFNLDDYNS